MSRRIAQNLGQSTALIDRGEVELGIFCDDATTILLWVPRRTRELQEIKGGSGFHTALRLRFSQSAFLTAKPSQSLLKYTKTSTRVRQATSRRFHSSSSRSE